LQTQFAYLEIYLTLKFPNFTYDPPMTVRCLLMAALCCVQPLRARALPAQIPDSLEGKSYDYLFERIEENSSEAARSAYLRTFVLKAQKEQNWEELSDGYKNYVHYAPDRQKLAYADSMVAAAKRSNRNEVIGSAYLSKGIAYYGQKRLSEAMDSYLVADSYIGKTDDQYLIHKTKYHIAQIKSYLGYYDEAISIFRQCISYFKKKNTRAYLNSLHSLGICYKMVGNHGLCTQTNELGIAEGIRTGNHDMEQYFLFSEGVNQCLIHNYRTAIDKLQAALLGIRANRDFSNEMVGYFYLGKACWGLGDKERAVAYFKKVDGIYRQRGYMRPDLRGAYEQLISYYRERGMSREQLFYVEKLLEVDKKLHLTHSYLQAKIQKEYDTKELLAAQQSLKRSLDKRKYNDRILTAVILALLLLVACGTARYYKNKKEARNKYAALLQRIEAISKAKAKSADPEKAMSRDAETAVLLGLKKFESSMKFLEKDLTLTKLASHFNTNTKYLSLIILKHRNKKFSEYVNGLKVDHIAQRIRKEKTLQNYTHEALADEAGFSSTRRFVNAFTANTGISPKYFIEELKKSRGGE